MGVLRILSLTLSLLPLPLIAQGSPGLLQGLCICRTLGRQALDLDGHALGLWRHARLRGGRGLPRSGSRQLGAQLQARPVPKLGPRQQWGRSEAHNAAREDSKKNGLQDKAGSARRPPNRPRNERFLYGGPKIGPEIWTPLLQSPRPKVRPKVKGKSKHPRRPRPSPWACQGQALARFSVCSTPLKAPVGGLRPLMGPKMGGDGGKVAKSIATSPRPDCAPTGYFLMGFFNF